MIGILIIAHGDYGQSLIHCAQHVMGASVPKLACLAVSLDDKPEQLLPKAQKLLTELDSGHGVLVLSDMYGATPCNTIAKLLKPNEVEGVAGVNLPMLVRVLTYRHETLAMLVVKAISGGRDGVVHFTQQGCSHPN